MSSDDNHRILQPPREAPDIFKTVLIQRGWPSEVEATQAWVTQRITLYHPTQRIVFNSAPGHHVTLRNKILGATPANSTNGPERGVQWVESHDRPLDALPEEAYCSKFAVESLRQLSRLVCRIIAWIYHTISPVLFLPFLALRGTASLIHVLFASVLPKLAHWITTVLGYAATGLVLVLAIRAILGALARGSDALWVPSLVGKSMQLAAEQLAKSCWMYIHSVFDNPLLHTWASVLSALNKWIGPNLHSATNFPTLEYASARLSERYPRVATDSWRATALLVVQAMARTADTLIIVVSGCVRCAATVAAHYLL